MDIPFREPNSLKCARCNFGDQAQDVRTAERREAIGFIKRQIGVAPVEGSTQAEQDQTGVKVRFVKRIEMHVRSEITPIADIARPIKHITCEWRETILDI